MQKKFLQTLGITTGLLIICISYPKYGNSSTCFSSTDCPPKATLVFLGHTGPYAKASQAISLCETKLSDYGYTTNSGYYCCSYKIAENSYIANACQTTQEVETKKTE